MALRYALGLSHRCSAAGNFTVDLIPSITLCLEQLTPERKMLTPACIAFPYSLPNVVHVQVHQPPHRYI